MRKTLLYAVLLAPLLLLALLATGAEAQAPSPTTIHGVMSRWEIANIQVSEQYSITPDLKNQYLAAYLNQLDQKGVNTAVINVQPSVTANQTCNLPTQQSISTQDWNNYTVALFLPDAAKNATQLQAFDSVRNTIENRNCTNGYTLAQRDSVILTFLQRVQTLYASGAISGNVKFFLDQRRWFQTGIDAQTRTRLEGEYASDLADIVTQAQSRGLAQWLLGIRLQEHNNGNMSELLPLIVDLAARVNSQTNNWLQTHTFIVNGGYYGADYNGIQRVLCPANDGTYQFTCTQGQNFSFFALIAKQTGAFAFGYKWMEVNWRGNQGQYMGGAARAYCQSYIAGCDPNNLTAANWTQFLNDQVNGTGFVNLKTFINNHAAQYPNHAQVVFIGDSSDSVFQMVTPSNGALADLPQMVALRALFQDAANGGGGWSGRIFMDAYSDRDFEPNDPTDVGHSLAFVDYSSLNHSGSSQAFYEPASVAFWQQWQP